FDYLRSHNRLSDLSFVSFEHYPFKECELQWSELYREADLTRHILQVWRDDGLPPGVPMFISETNIAACDDESFMDIFPALWWARFSRPAARLSTTSTTFPSGSLWVATPLRPATSACSQ